MFLVPAVPASIYKVSEDIIVNEGSNVTLTCFANGRPEPAITWRLLNPSGKDQPMLRDYHQCQSDGPVIIWTSEVFLCVKNAPFEGKQAAFWMRTHVGSQPVRTAVETNVGFSIRTCRCDVMDGDTLHVSARWQSRADGKLLYLYQLLRRASGLRTHFIKSICLLHLEAKPHGRVCLISSVCLR